MECLRIRIQVTWYLDMTHVQERRRDRLQPVPRLTRNAESELQKTPDIALLNPISPVSPEAGLSDQ